MPAPHVGFEMKRGGGGGPPPPRHPQPPPPPPPRPAAPAPQPLERLTDLGDAGAGERFLGPLAQLQLGDGQLRRRPGGLARFLVRQVLLARLELLIEAIDPPFPSGGG